MMSPLDYCVYEAMEHGARMPDRRWMLVDPVFLTESVPEVLRDSSLGCIDAGVNFGDMNHESLAESL